MKLPSKIIVLVFIGTLAGCASNMPTPNAKIPASLLVQCEPLEQLQGMTGKDLLTNITTNAAVYNRCNDHHKALIDAVKNN